MDIVILGLTITSSWGTSHATTYRTLVRALGARGHRVQFFERDQPRYAQARDLPASLYGSTRLYRSFEELRDTWSGEIARADLVMVGSSVPDGSEVARWVLDTAHGATAFYDIDTPETVARLAQRDYEYLHPSQIPRFDLYLSFTGGPLLQLIQRHFQASRTEPFYGSVDPEHYFPAPEEPQFDLGFMGMYHDDCQPVFDELLLKPAALWPEGIFAVAGPGYPESLAWPDNVLFSGHLPPSAQRRFYAAQSFNLNVTRREMVRAGYSPGVRLFEAAACGTPIISDPWRGLESFFRPGDEILIAQSAQDVLRYLRKLPERARRRLGERARARVLAAHTSAHRVQELERYLRRVRLDRARARSVLRQRP